jgi:hypothetical protein
LDGCVDGDGEIHPAAYAILERLDSYWEISPSGTGIHVIGKAKLITLSHVRYNMPWGGQIELYDSGRYFTVSGDGAGRLSERQQELDQLVMDLFPDQSLEGSQKALQSASGGRWLTEAEARDGWGEIRNVEYFLNRLRRDHRRYLETGHTGQYTNHKGGKDRNRIEQSILAHLVANGASDAQIKIIADSAFEKHLSRKTEAYLNRSIAKARQFVWERGQVNHPDGGWPRKPVVDKDLKYVHLAKGQPVQAWLDEVMSMVSRSAAYKIRQRLIEQERIEVRENCVYVL